MIDKKRQLIYLLHFPIKLGHSQHYMGITNEHRLHTRMKEHASGLGSKFTRAIASINQEFFLVRLWYDADRRDERRLKRYSHYSQHCPICLRIAHRPFLMRYDCRAFTIEPGENYRFPSFTDQSSETGRSKN